MPKPKRRPPVVKTDWVVEYERIGATGLPIPWQRSFQSERWARLTIDCSKNMINPRLYERKWRKVDL